MNKAVRGQRMDTVFVLMMFLVFAVSVLTVLMLGASVYKNVAVITQDGYNENTCLSYIWSKVKNSDEAGMVYIGQFQGIDVLCIDEVYGDTTYHTMIYMHDGWVRELFCEDGLDFDLEDGTPVIRAQSLSFQRSDDGLIRARSGGDDLMISPRGTINTAREGA